MGTLRLILGDQLSHSISSLEGCDLSQDIILMCEVWNESTYVKHHKKKIAFLFSAKIEYIKLDDKFNSGSFKGEIENALKRHKINRIIVTHPGEYRLLNEMKHWQSEFGVLVEIKPDSRFLCEIEEFANWAKDRKQLRMEYFYREMRKKYSILMDGEDPVGGQWNYDFENRKPPKNGLYIPKPYSNNKNEITTQVIELVAKRFSNHFGDLEPFYFAVTRNQALQVLKLFIEQRLCHFGDYQDAMIEGEPWMYHSHISFYLNCGLLLPLECVRAAEEAYKQRKVKLNAAEGFIRQIIGWREYIRCIYWFKMPEYAEKNFFEAKLNLPEFYWSANTDMNCMSQCIKETKENAYAHHIQRLMVLGNFALLAGIDPKQVNEWVELPNVSGMILFADGGYLASKPYASGGNYINKMSNYCKNCSYKVALKNGPEACPFNYLYWNFLSRNREKLESNHRIGMMYKTYDKMDEDKKIAIQHDSKKFLEMIQILQDY